MNNRKKSKARNQRKRAFCVTIAAAVLISIFVGSPVGTVKADQGKLNCTYKIEEYKNNTILVKFRDNGIREEQNNFIQHLNAKKVLQEGNFVSLKMRSREELRKSLKILENSELVEFVQPDFEYKAEALEQGTFYYGDTYIISEQWGLDNTGDYFTKDPLTGKKIYETAGIDCNVKPFWNYMKDNSGKEVVVAIVDSGMDVKHEAFKGKLWNNEKEIPGDGKDNDGNGYIDDYYGYNVYNSTSDLTDEAKHGTHCAGIIAANGTQDVWGVTGNAPIKLMPVKVFGDSELNNTDGPKSNSFSVLRGLVYAEKNGAKICNLSIGINGDDKLLYNYIKKSKMLIVCAAGNEQADIDNDPIYPAYYQLPNIISVANIRCDGTLHRTSNYSRNRVMIAAPGTQIYSSLPDDKYGYCTGTSMATPFVTGAAALLQSYLDDETAVSIKQRIRISAHKVQGLEDKVSTGGILDCYNALYVDAKPPEIKVSVSVKAGTNNAKISYQIVDNGTAGFQSAAWMEGEHDASDFQGGGHGNVLSDLGEITIHKAGKYTIYAVDANGNESVKVIKVTFPEPTKVILKKTKMTLKKGMAYKFNPKVSPTGVYVKYKYTSSNKRVATVSSKGIVSTKAKGTTVITIKTQNGKKATCRITVK